MHLQTYRRALLSLSVFLLCSVAVAAGAQNLTTNPGFDGGFAGWTSLEQDGVVETDWRAEDATGDVNSGSVRVDHDALSTDIRTGFTQCVTVTGSTEYTLGARTRVPLSQSASGAARVDLRWSSDGNCGDNLLLTTGIFDNSPGGWSLGQKQVVSPAAASSVLVMLRVEKTTDPDEDFDVDFDDVTLSASGGVGGTCVPDANTVCIGDRFRITGQYQTTQGGGSAGQMGAIDLSPVGVDRGGLMWFFRQANPELLIKVLDGCPVNGHYWVFSSAVTNVGFTVQVEDLDTGRMWFRTNPDLNAAPPVQDTAAFPCDG